MDEQPSASVRRGDARYGVPHEDSWDEDERDEASATLRDLPSHFTYLYDFGDGWEHDVDILGAGEAQPGCRSGQGARPPEDCGGPGGYSHLRAVLADPAHPEHRELREWVGTTSEFDATATDRRIVNTVGEVPASVRLLLDLLHDGAKLTPAGRLPRAIVREVQQWRPQWAWDERPAQREDDLVTLCALHDLLRQVGLLRLANGVLRPTKAAGDDLDVVRRLRSAFEPRSFRTSLAGDAVAVLTTFGPQSTSALAAQVLPLLGWGWTRDGSPLTQDDVRREIAASSSLLQALDQIEADSREWQAGPSALSLLPRVTGLGAAWAETGPAQS